MILRITADHFVAGAEISEAGWVSYPIAPIIRYMNGWHLKRVKVECDFRGWKYEVIDGA
jgi:hypothetical protein